MQLQPRKRREMPTKYIRGSGHTHPVDIYVGQRLQERRQQCGLSLAAFATLTGKTYQQISKYETGANRISASVLHDLGRALHVAPAYFFDGYIPDDPAPYKPDHPPAPATWSRLYYQLQPDDTPAVITMIKMFIRRSKPERLP